MLEQIFRIQVSLVMIKIIPIESAHMKWQVISHTQRIYMCVCIYSVRACVCVCMSDRNENEKEIKTIKATTTTAAAAIIKMNQTRRHTQMHIQPGSQAARQAVSQSHIHTHAAVLSCTGNVLWTFTLVTYRIDTHGPTNDHVAQEEEHTYPVCC